MPCESKLCTQRFFDSRVCPAGNIAFQIVLQNIFKIVKPAEKIKIGSTRVGVDKADIFVYEAPAMHKADVIADEFSGYFVAKYFAAAVCILQKIAEKCARENIKMNIALRKDIFINAPPLGLSENPLTLLEKLNEFLNFFALFFGT